MGVYVTAILLVGAVLAAHRPANSEGPARLADRVIAVYPAFGDPDVEVYNEWLSDHVRVRVLNLNRGAGGPPGQWVIVTEDAKSGRARVLSDITAAVNATQVLQGSLWLSFRLDRLVWQARDPSAGGSAILYVSAGKSGARRLGLVGAASTLVSADARWCLSYDTDRETGERVTRMTRFEARPPFATESGELAEGAGLTKAHMQWAALNGAGDVVALISDGSSWRARCLGLAGGRWREKWSRRVDVPYPTGGVNVGLVRWALSADGSRAAVFLPGEGTAGRRMLRLYVADMRTGRARVLGEADWGPGSLQPEWTRDGRCVYTLVGESDVIVRTSP